MDKIGSSKQIGSFNSLDDVIKIQNHTINVSCNIDLIDNHNIPSFAEKMIGNIIYNIFNRLKQFIENISF